MCKRRLCLERIRYYYCKEKKVKNLKEIGDNVFSATVVGSSAEPYSVELNIDHPRKSKCNCPHANGKRIICKHLVATYFTALPMEADKFYEEAVEYQQEAEKRQEELVDRVVRYVEKMKKSELQQTVIQLLFDGPEWQYDRFVRDNGIDADW